MTNNERIQANNAELREAIQMAENLPDAGTPTPTQEKTVDITENGIHMVTPDDGYALSKVTANVNVPTGGGGDGELLFTTSGAIYVEELVVPETITTLSSGVYNINGIKSITALGVTSLGGHYCFGGAWNSLEVLICPRLTSWPGNYWCRGGNLREVQAGSIGYPVTAMLNTKGFDLNSRSDLVITIYVDATTLAEVPTDVSDYAPFGATKATIIYRNSTTGEVISE